MASPKTLKKITFCREMIDEEWFGPTFLINSDKNLGWKEESNTETPRHVFLIDSHKQQSRFERIIVHMIQIQIAMLNIQLVRNTVETRLHPER